MKEKSSFDSKLFGQALIKFFAGLLIVSALVFVPAGTLRYPQGLLFTVILFVPMFIAGLVMMAKAPDLLRRRLDGKETEGDQKTVIALSGLMFLAAFVVAGLNFRFGWLILPKWVLSQKGSRSSTPGCTGSSVTRCTRSRWCCSCRCRSFSGPCSRL